MKRYMLYVSYLGTKYRGIQVLNVLKTEEYKDHMTVGGLLEIALEGCKATNKPKIVTSSRTDRGVHALRNTVQVDLECKYGELKPRYILTTLNKYFADNKHDIRVQEVRIVPDDFSVRYHAQARHYMYRFAVKKPGVPIADHYNKSFSLPRPVIEEKRCHFVYNSTFNVEAANSACQLFIGTKNFIALLGRPYKSQKKNISSRKTVRTLDSLELRPGRPLIESPYTELYNFWEVHCHGKSFLYNQVRRTVAVLIAVANGILTLEDVKKLFDKPNVSSWNDKAAVVPAYGLYLTDIIYNEEDLFVPEPVINKLDKPENIDWKNFTGSIHEKINLRQLQLKHQRKVE